MLGSLRTLVQVAASDLETLVQSIYSLYLGLTIYSLALYQVAVVLSRQEAVAIATHDPLNVTARAISSYQSIAEQVNLTHCSH